MYEVIFCQVSTKLIQPDNPCLDYYEKVYPKCEGYHLASEHFMEIPTWIGVISGMLGHEHCKQSLHIVEDVDKSVEWLSAQNEMAIVMFSVLEVNKRFVNEIVERIPQVSICGGYVHPDTVNDKALWLDKVTDLQLPFMNKSASPDYSLFEGMMTIPRLTLSTGCTYNCAFCTIEREIQEVSFDDAYEQALSFKGLSFELVYLNDKTFGQADNWKWIASLYDVIQEYNPEFKGFIVQTTIPYALEYAQEWASIGVRYIECGVEAVSREYLKKMRKPYKLEQLGALVQMLRQSDLNVGFIPNIIFGLPGAKYDSTLAWLWLNADVISFINPYVLCQYDTSKGDMVERKDEIDTDENTIEKSWLGPEEIDRTKDAMRQAFFMTGGGI